MEILAFSITNLSIGILGIVLSFGLAVFIHELGHFLAAKAFGVPVERFVIGFDKEAMPFMPKCIWERKIGDTVYGLSLMPLGGYVKMSGTIHPDIEKYLDGGGKPEPKTEGETVETEKYEPATSKTPTDMTQQAITDQTALYKKPLWQKVVIYSAGVVMNLLLAMAVVAGISAKGETIEAPRDAIVGWTAPDAWINGKGLEQGDRITAVNEIAVSTNEDYTAALNTAFAEVDFDNITEGQTLNVTFTGLRDGQEFETTLALPITESRDEITDVAYLMTRPAFMDYVILNQPADKAGIQEGDEIISINGEPIDDWYEMAYIIRQSVDQKLDIVIRRPIGYKRGVKPTEFEEVALEVTPTESSTEKGIGQIGVMPGSPDMIVMSLPVGTAIIQSPKVVYLNVMNYLSNLRQIGSNLIHGEFSRVRKDLGGPVAIAQMAGHHANLGLDRFLQFMVMLNIALAVMNILPIPVLDGGHIMFAIYEAIFGKPIPPKVLVPVFEGALFTLLAFVVLITFSDLFKIFS